ncbi:MAG: aldo/keto reductase [Chitinophagaceae bacterium]
MKFRKLGTTNIQLSAIGLGCMGMSHAYGEPDDKASIATLEKALEIGVNFWDTADIYGNGENERLISKVLVPNRNRIFIATKFGFKLQGDGKLTVVDGSPAYLQTAVEASLKRLNIEVIDLYYAHRIDPKVPVEDMAGAMADLVKQGKVRFIGLSEASPASIRLAHAVHPISALQSEYSVMTRDVEAEILPLCRELGISFVPFSPLARGLITNTLKVEELTGNDFRRSLPRYQEDFAENNSNLSNGFALIAERKDCTAAQLALAWVLSQGEYIIPIPGTKKIKYLLENAVAAEVTLTNDDRLAIEDLLERFPDTGNRYNEANWQFIDR